MAAPVSIAQYTNHCISPYFPSKTAPFTPQLTQYFQNSLEKQMQ